MYVDGPGRRLDVDAADVVTVDAVDLRCDPGGSGRADRLLDEIAEMELEPVGIVLTFTVQRLEIVLQTDHTAVVGDTDHKSASVAAVEEGSDGLERRCAKGLIAPALLEIPFEGRLEFKVGILIAGEEVADRYLPLPGDPGSRVDLDRHTTRNLGTKLIIVEQGEAERLVTLHLLGDGGGEALVELEPEVLERVRRRLQPHLRVGGHVKSHRLQMQSMGLAEIHAVPLVEVAHDPRQRLLLGWARITLRVVDRPHLASVAVDDDAAFGRQNLAQVREFDLAAEVDGIA